MEQWRKLTCIPEDIETIFKRCYEELYTQPTAADEEEMRAFLRALDFPLIGYLQKETLTAEITIEEVNDAIKTLKKQEIPR